MQSYFINSCIKEDSCILIFTQDKDWFYIQFMQAWSYTGRKRLLELIKDLSSNSLFIGGRDLTTIKLRFKQEDVYYDEVKFLFPI